MIAGRRRAIDDARARPGARGFAGPLRSVALAALAAAISVVAAAAEPTSGAAPAALARVTTAPLGLPAMRVLADNPPTAAKIALGRKLFFDRRLSVNGTMSCAMCHLPEQGFTSNELARPVGIEGRSIRRNSPTLYNVAYVTRLFHDGRGTSLETQVLGPLLDRHEMGNPSIGHVVSTVASLPDYQGLFERAFGAGPSVDRIGQAIASYERTLLSANSPFDRWYFGREGGALSPAAVAGFRLFTGKAGCAGCHSIAADHALFTDGGFHDTGIGRARVARQPGSNVDVELAPGVVVAVAREIVESVGDPEPADLGRHEITLDPADVGKFRTPSLRNVALTAPYTHDGSLRTLLEVVEHYNRGGTPHAGQDGRIRPLGLTAAEVSALVAFLESLTGDNVETLAAEARAPEPGPPGTSDR